MPSKTTTIALFLGLIALSDIVNGNTDASDLFKLDEDDLIIKTTTDSPT